MIRKLALALAAVLALSLPMLPTSASAQRGFHGGGFHGGWHGGGWHGGWHGGGWGWGGLGLGLGLGAYYGAYPYPYYYGGYYGCYRPIRVATPWGPRWRRVWVCG